MKEYKILNFGEHKYMLYTFDDGEKIPSYMKRIDFSKLHGDVIPAYMYAGEYKVFEQFAKDHKAEKVTITLEPTESDKKKALDDLLKSINDDYEKQKEASRMFYDALSPKEKKDLKKRGFGMFEWL